MLQKDKKITAEDEDYNLDPRVDPNKEEHKLLGFVLENAVWRILCASPENFITLFGKPGKLLRHENTEDKYDFRIEFDDGTIYYFDVKTRSTEDTEFFTIPRDEYRWWRARKRENENTQVFVICLTQIEPSEGLIKGMWEIGNCCVEPSKFTGFRFRLPYAESMI